MQIPEPIFKKRIFKISWKKIYEREYGVQYSEVAVSLLSGASYHFPKTSTDQIVVPGQGNNTAFYISATSWVELVEALNQKYTSSTKKLAEYEKQFLYDGKNYLETAKKISKLDLKKLSSKELLSIFLDHQDKRLRYSCFAWTAFILNNYIADKATSILDTYIKKYKRQTEKQLLYDALFRPEKRAAVLELQYQVEKHNGKLTERVFEDLYNRFKWLSCLDIQDKPWTKQEFKEHIKSFNKRVHKKELQFSKVAKELHISSKGLDYLLMAKRFVYIKDARDDFRRESVYYALSLYKEIGRRVKIAQEDIGYLQESEIVDFLLNKVKVTKNIIEQRKNGFVVYLDLHKVLVCLQGNQIKQVLQMFGLGSGDKDTKGLVGKVASQGQARGKVAIVYGVKDLSKVRLGNILVAVTTHPDYVAAMRKAAAIITDEGGITSHAAIVAREFGIPCIVGTKNSTKILKDGDFIEVNAIDGKIKKIKV